MKELTARANFTLVFLKFDHRLLLSCSYYGSGGPLLDSKGNLIGINTAIFTQTGK